MTFSVYAVVVSWLSIVILGAFKLWDSAAGTATALVALCKISFCLLSAAAWAQLFATSSDYWLLCDQRLQ
eukprot:gene9936-3851_t